MYPYVSPNFLSSWNLMEGYRISAHESGMDLSGPVSFISVTVNTGALKGVIFHFFI
jgi:hypothetical protein